MSGSFARIGKSGFIPTAGHLTGLLLAAPHGRDEARHVVVRRVASTMRNAAASRRQDGRQGVTARDLPDAGLLPRDEQDLAQHDAHDARAQADDERLFGVEHLGNVHLGSANGAQNADLFPALQHADMRRRRRS